VVQTLKENLTSRFSPYLDKSKAFEMLVNLGQKRDEDIRFFAQCMLGLAQQ